MRARDAVSAVWASALARAVPTSSVNAASRASMPIGSGSSAVEAATMTPHKRAPTLMGAPTPDRNPRTRTGSDTGPEISL